MSLAIEMRIQNEAFLILTLLSQSGEKCQCRGHRWQNFVFFGYQTGLRSAYCRSMQIYAKVPLWNQTIIVAPSTDRRSTFAVRRPLIFNVHCPSLPWPFRADVWLPISDCCLSKSDQDKLFWSPTSACLFWESDTLGLHTLLVSDGPS